MQWLQLKQVKVKARSFLFIFNKTVLKSSEQASRYFGGRQSRSNVDDNDPPGCNLPLKRRRKRQMLQLSFPLSAQRPCSTSDDTTAH